MFRLPWRNKSPISEFKNIPLLLLLLYSPTSTKLNSTERHKLLTTLNWKILYNCATKNQSVWVVSLLYAYHLLLLNNVAYSGLIKILNNIFPVLWSSRSFYKVSEWFPYSITYLINNSVYSRFPHFILITDCDCIESSLTKYRSVASSRSSADIGGRTLYYFSSFGRIKLRRWLNRSGDIRVYLKNVKRSFSLANKNVLLYAPSRERSTFNGEIQNLRF